ncbi:MAG: nickel/cobalt transporter [Actinomycetota bacterium]
MRRRLSIFGLALVGILVLGPAAFAHPLGNFSINQFGGIEVGTETVRVHYVVDMAEIPTLQQLGSDATKRRVDAFASDLAPRLLENLALEASGEELDLEVESVSAVLGSGAGGLKTLRLELELRGSLPEPAATIEYRDRNYADRLGWKEVVAYGTGRQGIESASVPAQSASDELNDYPRNELSSPLDQRSATIRVRPGATSPAVSEEARKEGAGALGGSFAALVAHDLTPGFALSAILLAIGFGALHALGPGHGKSVMAAYLIGAEGRVRHAVGVGVAVSVMHTASVVALGLVTLWASRLFTPEAVYPWLSLVSGVVVLGLGAFLLRARLRGRRAPHHPSDHSHDHHDHHVHDHGFGPHTHEPPATAVLSWKGLGAIALSGGLLPSPSALVVLLGSVALHRIGFGLLLVGAFSVGLAAALTLLGALVLRARSFASRRLNARASSLIPVLSAAAVTTLGGVLTARALIGL